MFAVLPEQSQCCFDLILIRSGTAVTDSQIEDNSGCSGVLGASVDELQKIKRKPGAGDEQEGRFSAEKREGIPRTVAYR